jgi:YhgE/Pip-like protein
MNGIRSFFAQKTVWIGLAAMIAVIAVLGWAILGSTVNPIPKNLPIALVAADRGAEIPGVGKVNVGEMIKQKLTTAQAPSGEASPFAWTVLDSETEALAGLDRQTYYAVMVLPDNLSANYISLMSPAPMSAGVRVLINQGKSGVAATMATQALGKMVEGINVQLREQAFVQIRQVGGSNVTIEQAKALAAPLAASFETVHPIAANTANGNAPVVLTQLAWLAALTASALLYLTGSKLKEAGRLAVVAAQLIAGAIYAAVAAGSELLISGSLFGLHVPDRTNTFLFLTLAVFCFFLLQSAVISWIGLKAMPILVLLFFFGLPILGLPPEFLPDTTRDWLYSWIPFRFSVEGLRDLFYFRQGLNVGAPAAILGWIGVAGAALMIVSVTKRRDVARGAAGIGGSAG